MSCSRHVSHPSALIQPAHVAPSTPAYRRRNSWIILQSVRAVRFLSLFSWTGRRKSIHSSTVLHYLNECNLNVLYFRTYSEWARRVSAIRAVHPNTFSFTVIRILLDFLFNACIPLLHSENLNPSSSLTYSGSGSTYFPFHCEFNAVE